MRLVRRSRREARARARTRAEAHARAWSPAFAVGTAVDDETGLLGNAVDTQHGMPDLDVAVAHEELEYQC